VFKVESVKYSAYQQTAQADYLNGNIQDDVKVVITFSLERVFFVSTDNRLMLTPPPEVYGSFDNTRIIFAPDDTLAFQEFQVGDIVRIKYFPTSPVLSDYTITEKISDNAFRVAQSIPTLNIDASGEYIACVSAPKSLKYKYNFVSSDDAINYNNHIDGQENVFLADNITTATGFATSMYQNGSKSHHIGSAMLSFVSRINTFKLVYSITHTTKLFPFLEEGQADDLINGTPFDGLAGDKSINHPFEIDFLREQGDETDMLVLESVEAVGETGGYNEHFNSGVSDYYVESTEFKVAGQVIDGIDLDKSTDIRIIYKSNGKFTGLLRTEVTFMLVHDDFDNYNDPTQTYLENFCFCSQSGSSALNQGTDYSVFVGGLYYVNTIDVNTREITVRTFLGDKIKDNIAKSAVPRYALFVSNEQVGLPVVSQTRSRDLASIGEFVQTLPSIDLITTNTEFLLDPADQERGYKQTLPQLFMTDDVQANTSFSYSKTTPIKLLSIKNEIVAVGANDTVVLDTITASVAGSQLDPNGVQIISVNTLRPLNQSYKNTLIINRGADTTTDYVFNMSFPFIVGYREDKAIIGQSIPSEVFDLTAVGKGLSADWVRYQQAGMSLRYRITFTFSYLGKTYNQTVYKPISVNDYNSPEWDTHSITLYDQLDAPLTDGVDQFIKDEVTIVATFDKAILPNLSDLQCYFFVAKINSDGVRTSSTYDNTFKKILFGNISIEAGEILCKAKLNAEDFKSDVRIWCRLFEREGTEIPDCVIIAEGGEYMYNESGSGFLIPEICGEPTTFYIIDSLGEKLKDSEGNRFPILG